MCEVCACVRSKRERERERDTIQCTLVSYGMGVEYTTVGV